VQSQNFMRNDFVVSWPKNKTGTTLSYNLTCHCFIFFAFKNCMTSKMWGIVVNLASAFFFPPSRSIPIRLNSPIHIHKVALSLYQCKKFCLNPTKGFLSSKIWPSFQEYLQAAEIDRISSNVEIEGSVVEETDQHRKSRETAAIQPLRVPRQLHSLHILLFIFHVDVLKHDLITVYTHIELFKWYFSHSIITRHILCITRASLSLKW